MNSAFYDMKTPSGHLFDSTILNEDSCIFVNGFNGDVVDREEHEVYREDLRESE